MYVQTFDIVAYSYKDDILCPDCTTRTVVPEADLSNTTEYDLDNAAQNRGIDRHDESSFDSSEFPKVVFADHLIDDVCGSCLVQV